MCQGRQYLLRCSLHSTGTAWTRSTQPAHALLVQEAPGAGPHAGRQVSRPHSR